MSYIRSFLKKLEEEHEVELTEELILEIRDFDRKVRRLERESVANRQKRWLVEGIHEGPGEPDEWTDYIEVAFNDPSWGNSS